MPDLKKLPLQTREVDEFAFETRAEGKPAKLRFSLSSETPVERWFGTEILSHEKGAVRMERINRRAMPLLFNHNPDDPVGMVESGELRDGRLYVDAAFFDTARARDVALMVEGGLRNVSVGYRIHTFSEDAKSGDMTATDWEPYEASIAPVPADPTVGHGRASAQEFELSFRSNPAKPAEVEITMTESTAPAGASAEQKPQHITALQAEKERREAVADLCKANKIDARVEMRWIEDGTSLPTVARELLDVLQDRQSAKPSGASVLGMSKNETQRYSMVRAIRALKFPTSANLAAAGFEQECSNAVAKQLNRGDTGSLLIPTDVLSRPIDANAFNQRAMATAPGASGGYLVGVENMGFIEILRNRSVAMAMGARQLSGLTGNVVFPRQTGKSTVTWQGGDGTSVTATDQALGQLSMTPKTAIIVTDVSEQLLRQASPSAEAFITADLAATIAIDGVDNAVINGTGGAQPLGIKNTTGVTTGQDSSTATYAKVLAFISTAGGSNAIRGNPGFVTNIAGAVVLMQRQRFTSTDSPLWEGNAIDGSLVKFNAKSSEQLASGNLIFGSWDEVVIGDWGVLELSTDTGGTRFNQAQVGIRALWMVDVLLRYPQAFVVSVNLS